MKVTFTGTNTKIKECVEFTNELFSIEEFWQEIEAVEKFTHTELKTNEISERIKECTVNVTIKLYKPRWRFSKANAYVTSKYPNTLFLNTRKLWRTYPLIINTIFHECVHIADYGDDDSKITFGHGSNSPKGKENSAPYWIGELAGKYFENSAAIDAEIEKIEIIEDLIIE